MGQGTRVEARREAAQFEHDIRSLLAELEQSCARRPQPKDLVKDVVRGRPASEETLLAALLTVARAAPVDAVLRFTQQLFARLIATTHPAQVPCSWTAFVAETQAQGPADLAQVNALHAIELGDRVAIDRAIESTVAHTWRSLELVTALTTARESIYRGRVVVARRITQ